MIAVVLGAALLSTACAPLGCPTALLIGVLEQQAGELVVVPEQGGEPPVRVKWPGGYGLRREGDAIVVTDIFGIVKARQGDIVRLGGGENEDKVFVVCGMFEVGPDPAGRTAAASLTAPPR